MGTIWSQLGLEALQGWAGLPPPLPCPCSRFRHSSMSFFPSGPSSCPGCSSTERVKSPPCSEKRGFPLQSYFQPRIRDSQVLPLRCPLHFWVVFQGLRDPPLGRKVETREGPHREENVRPQVAQAGLLVMSRGASEAVGPLPCVVQNPTPCKLFWECLFSETVTSDLGLQGESEQVWPPW